MDYIEVKQDFVDIDHPDNPHLLEEAYKAVDRQTHGIRVKNLELANQVLFQRYQDYTIENGVAIYSKVWYGVDNTKVGDVKIDYIRELPNRTYRNERAIELGLAKYFAEKFNNQIVELGAVCHQYSFFKDWEVVDPYDPYPKSIRKDIMDYDYTGKNVLSISTVEHCGMDLGYNQPKDEQLAIRGVQKIIHSAVNYLITFPIGVHRKLESWVHEATDYLILKRISPRSEWNEWMVGKPHDFSLNYGHFAFEQSYYGSALAICVVTNLEELFGSKI